MEGTPSTLRGREAVIQHYRGQFEAQLNTGLSQRIEPMNSEELAGYVVAVATVSMDVEGEGRSFHTVELCRLQDGKLAERWAMFDRPEVPQSIIAEVRRR